MKMLNKKQEEILIKYLAKCIKKEMNNYVIESNRKERKSKKLGRKKNAVK